MFVTGAGFVNSTSLSCRLGREIVPATYLSPFTLLCVAPEQPTGAGTVFIEVSNNGEDWTSQRTLFHFAPCPAGYYCPEGEPLPCPRGAFCGGGSGGAANFTLCPVGTFQPRTTQSSASRAHRVHLAGRRHVAAQRVPARRGVRRDGPLRREQGVPSRALLPGGHAHVQLH